jgi:hypothetical protein
LAVRPVVVSRGLSRDLPANALRGGHEPEC